MAFYVRLYSLSKRDNSTKRPEGDGNLQRCILRRGSSLMTPVLEFDFGTDTDSNPIGYNYCYIPQFERYFFIEDWTFSGALWIASCRCDVLATYKDVIGATSMYVLRASAAYDGAITDEMYPAKTGCTFDSAVVSTPWILSGGTFVLGVVNQDPTIGGLCYFAMTAAQVSSVLNALLADSFLSNNDVTISGVSKDALKGLMDPVQYIKSAVYIPVAKTYLGGVVTSFRLNGWSAGFGSLGTEAINVNQARYTITKTFSIPKHPQAASRGTYLNQAPFSVYTLTVPPFGTIDIDSTVLRNASSLTAEVTIDLPTGLGILTVTCNGIVLNRLEANVGVPVQLSQVSRDYVGGITSVLSGVSSIAGGVAGGIATGGAMGVVTGGSGVASGLSSIGDAVKALTPRAESVGSGGSYAQLVKDWRLDAQFFPIVDEDNAHNGRPYCKLATPASLGGYMMIRDGDVAILGTSTEDAAVRSYLQTGFYYE
jgi:hypothetical protein